MYICWPLVSQHIFWAEQLEFKSFWIFSVIVSKAQSPFLFGLTQSLLEGAGPSIVCVGSVFKSWQFMQEGKAQYLLVTVMSLPVKLLAVMPLTMMLLLMSRPVISLAVMSLCVMSLPVMSLAARGQIKMMCCLHECALRRKKERDSGYVCVIFMSVCDRKQGNAMRVVWRKWSFCCVSAVFHHVGFLEGVYPSSDAKPAFPGFRLLFLEGTSAVGAASLGVKHGLGKKLPIDYSKHVKLLFEYHHW